MRTYILVLVLIGGVLLPAGSADALAPQPALNKILKELTVFEESFEKDQWQEAELSLRRIDAELQEVFNETMTDDPDMKKALWALHKSVDRKDMERTEAHYILFQKQYFLYLEGFEYKVPPLLVTLQQHVVNEALEFFAARNYGGVVAVMRESVNLVDLTRSLFGKKGIAASELVDFKTKLIQTMGAGRDHDDARLEALLQELKERYLSFMERYRGA